MHYSKLPQGGTLGHLVPSLTGTLHHFIYPRYVTNTNDLPHCFLKDIFRMFSIKQTYLLIFVMDHFENIRPVETSLTYLQLHSIPRY